MLCWRRRVWVLSVKVHTGYFSVVYCWCCCCYFPFLYRHTHLCPRVHLTRWGSESRQESEEARGGRMQHQGEGGRRWRRGRKLKSQNLERKEDRRKKWRRKRRRSRSERASPVEQQVGRYERRWGGGEVEGPGEQAGWRRWRCSRGNTSTEGVWISVQQQDDEFQPKKTISFHQNKPVKKNRKNSQKEKKGQLLVFVCRCLSVPLELFLFFLNLPCPFCERAVAFRPSPADDVVLRPK